ncbi:hypothetical protein [Streptomyces celluloflavus]|uniref:hypothetical protein n=1 Tax=Streptomyces celluloflavus TaxID=58344 RepID=UPI00368ADC30
MTGVYALIDPDGRLEFRDGVPDPMLGNSDPQHGAPAPFTIQRAARGGNGLQGHIGNVSCLAGTYPPNRIATAVVTVLGGPQEYIFGNLTICGSQSAPVSGEPPCLCGLTEIQQDLIDDVHTAVSKAADNSP